MPRVKKSERARARSQLIAGQDPNCLPPTGYRFDGHAITLTKLDAEPPLIQRLLA